MKRVLLLSIAVLCVAGLAWGQDGGRIGIFSDNPGFSDCNLVESVGAPNDLYVVHYARPQANTSQFKVLDEWGAFAAGENFGTNLFLPSQAGMGITAGGTITYVGCKTLPHLLVTMTFIPFAPSGDCGGTLSIVPDPVIASGQIEMVACDGSTIFFPGGDVLTVNGNDTDCKCGVATEETTWSRVKALYK